MTAKPQTTALTIADNLTLPIDAITQKFAFLARSGAGKTYSATKLCELMLQAGAQVVALDVVGVWYGLRLSADGKGNGFSIPVFGGEHGDLPLTPNAGALIADLIVDKGICAVLDVSNFRKNERKQFVTDFAEQLFHRKKTARSALHLFFEECQVYVPQKTFKGEERMLGAFEDLIKLGRNYGVGVSLISQRPQAVNKDVLNQTECLFALQTSGPQERKTIRDWIHEKGLNENIDDMLPKLEIGEAHVWSPQWLKISKTVRILKKRTYDASATPVFGSEIVKPKELSPVDVEQIKNAMSEVIEKAEESNPKTLQKRIRELETELKKVQHAKPLTEIKAVEISVLKPEDIELLNGKIQLVNSLAERFEIATQSLKASIENLTSACNSILPHKDQSRLTTIPLAKTRKEQSVKTDTPVKAYSQNVANLITRPQQRIIDALASFEALGLTNVAKSNVAVFSDQSPKSSGFTNNLGHLRNQLGLIEYPISGMICLTDKGRACAGEVERITTLEQLHQAWFRKLPSPRIRILENLIRIYPQQIDKAALADLSGQSATSSGYTNNLGALRSLGLIDYPQSGYVAATELLFPDGLI